MNPHRPTARDGVHKDQPTKNQQPPPWCKPCQKEVRPVRPKISIAWLALCIALCWFDFATAGPLRHQQARKRSHLPRLPTAHTKSKGPLRY